MPTFNSKELRNLLKQDFWTQPELEWILLGPYHPFLQSTVTDPVTPSIEVESDFQIKTEKMLAEIFNYIDDTESIGKLRKSKQKIERRLFLENPPIALPINHWGYEAIDLLTLLQEKEYPIPKELIQSIKVSNWDIAVNKTQTLHELMINRINFGLTFKQAGEIVPAPNGTEWKDVTITLIANDSVEVSIEGKKERLSYHELGFSDKRRGDGPNNLWKFFIILIKSDGEINTSSGVFHMTSSSDASRFNKHMQSIFGITQSVFPNYKKKKAYRATFKTSDRTHGAAEELIQSLPYSS